MAATTPIITISDFAPYQELSSYLNAAKIDPHILACQYEYLRPILGNTLYDSLQDYIANSKTPTDTDLDNLIVYVNPYLCYRSFARYLKQANIFPSNMGFRVLREANSEPITDKDRLNLISMAKDSAVVRENDLREFLCENKDTYNWDGCKATKQRFSQKISKIGRKYQDPGARNYKRDIYDKRY